jgi:hypothetical protein
VHIDYEPSRFPEHASSTRRILPRSLAPHKFLRAVRKASLVDMAVRKLPVVDEDAVVAISTFEDLKESA